MDSEGNDGDNSFKVVHGLYAAEVTNLYESGAQVNGDVIREA